MPIVCSLDQIAVEKIVALRPHLLLVGKTVCRVAQDLLREREVALIQNVKVWIQRYSVNFKPGTRYCLRCMNPSGAF